MSGGPGPDPAPAGAVPVILVPEVRDYLRINAELVALLDRGHRRVRLEGVDGQRLIAAGLAGPWSAVVEVEGRTGPELGARLDAPGLTLVARGDTRDGAGSGLRAGSLVVLGDAGDGLGYAQSGGILLVAGRAGHRAGLRQSGGTLAVLGPVGRLAGDRRSGGTFFLDTSAAGPHRGRGQSGGRWVDWPAPIEPVDEPARAELARAAAPFVALPGAGRP